MKTPLIALLLLVLMAGYPLAAQTSPRNVPPEDADIGTHWLTGAPLTPIHVKAWPGGKRVAVIFVLHVEEFGFGRGPVFRPDMLTRETDAVNGAWRQYSIEWGLPRVGRLFQEQGVPLTISLNAAFPQKHPLAWQQVRSLLPNAPIIAHGVNNTTEMLPMAGGPEAQRAYIRRVLETIEKDTGVRTRGWSSPSVYPNGDTFAATAAEGITYTLDGMDSDVLSRLSTKSGPLVLIPYPAVTVDMGQFFQRAQQPSDIERLWIDCVTELAREAAEHPERDATVIAIGIHSFVVGTPDGAAAMRRTLESFKRLKLVWLTDTQHVLDAAGEKH